MASVKERMEAVVVSCPASHKVNNAKEQLVLEFVENFRRQFVQLYPERRPLLLYPRNECGVEKFVCTTIRPTQLRFKELYDLQGCAQFISDHIKYEPLSDPLEPPSILPCPSHILAWQAGNAFDMSMVLCSLLLGAGYDAYVVCGCAVRQTTMNIQTKEVCPLLEEEKKETTAVKPVDDDASLKKEAEEMVTAALTSMAVEEDKPKYTFRRQKKPESQFLKRQSEQKEKEVLEKEEEEEEEEEEPVDEWKGARVHAWVLVRAGKRQLEETLFVEPSAGKLYPPEHEAYEKIESLWNGSNYWINMKPEEEITALSFDLMDTTHWEYVFPSGTSTINKEKEEKEEKDVLEEEEEEEEEEEKPKEEQAPKPQTMQRLDIPPSWVEQLHVSKEKYQLRWPGGEKMVIYHKCKQEVFAPYHREDGMVVRLSIFGHRSQSEASLIEIREKFAHRKDCLDTRLRFVKEGRMHEQFVPGRPHHLKDHIHIPGEKRIMLFYADASLDGLIQREERFGHKVMLTYKGRPDRRSYMSATFSDSEGVTDRQVNPVYRIGETPIYKMAEKFACDPDEDDPNVDPEKITYSLAFRPGREDDRDKEKIIIRFHRSSGHVTQSMRTYVKEGRPSEFQVNTMAKPLSDLEVFDEYQELLHKERECLQALKDSDTEAREILRSREEEEKSHKLLVSVYDTKRYKKERGLAETIIREQDDAVDGSAQRDYLTPYIAMVREAMLGTVEEEEPLTFDQAQRVRELALKALKDRLIEKAYLIQSRLDGETAKLQHRQATYHQRGQDAMDEEETAQWNAWYKDQMFRIHVLESRLVRHEDDAVRKYNALSDKLDADPRLEVLHG